MFGSGLTLEYSLLRIESPSAMQCWSWCSCSKGGIWFVCSLGFLLNLHWPRFDMIDVDSYSIIFTFRNSNTVHTQTQVCMWYIVYDWPNEAPSHSKFSVAAQNHGEHPINHEPLAAFSCNINSLPFYQGSYQDIWTLYPCDWPKLRIIRCLPATALPKRWL